MIVSTPSFHALEKFVNEISSLQNYPKVRIAAFMAKISCQRINVGEEGGEAKRDHANSILENIASISQHHFASRVSILTPRPQDSTGKCRGNFSVITARPTIFLDPSFIEKYIKHGDLYCLSSSHPTLSCNSMCIVRGKLYLHVDVATYKKLGLVGSEISLHQTQKIFRISIDLLSESFCPGNKQYDRISWCLSRMQTAKLLVAHVQQGRCEPVELPDHQGEGCKNFQNNYSCISKKDVDIPVLTPACDGKLEAFVMQDLIEWIGLCTLQNDSRGSGDVDEFVEFTKAPQFFPTVKGDVFCQSISGFIPAPVVIQEVKELWSSVCSRHLGWAIIVVWGFDDTNMSWRECLHTDCGGFRENDTVMILMPNNKIMICDMIGSGDTYS
eukprot:673578-Hanusia_phi.AAC.2